MVPTETALTGLRIGVTSGPTRAWLDPVRYIANASTGELGATIASLFQQTGARVDYVHGPGAITPNDSPRIERFSVESPLDLLAQLEFLAASQTQEGSYTAWIHSMAVLDFVPIEFSEGKISGSKNSFTLGLKPTPKVIDRFRSLFPASLLVGFKLATTNHPSELRQAAIDLATRSGCDWVVANHPPFEDPISHEAWIWESAPQLWSGPAIGKQMIAREVVRVVSQRILHGHE